MPGFFSKDLPANMRVHELNGGRAAQRRMKNRAPGHRETQHAGFTHCGTLHSGGFCVLFFIFLLKAVMFPLRALFSIWLFLVLLKLRLLRASGAKQPGVAQQIGGGTFVTSDGTRCAWSAGEAGEAVKVWVNCERQGGVNKTGCEYRGRPRSCPGYNSDPKAFWKQVARAFKKMRDKVCVDFRALVKARMCKQAPRDANLRLDRNSVKRSTAAPTTPPVQPTSAACVKRADQRRTADEFCSSWASVCAFFMSMLQSEDC
ncbi:PREDICTED: fibroblast growth factor-binding protein 1-like [Poecilia mexicana]|uniref:Fibroblast growth factor binding protein 1b n=1 Tax=Poecilia mexicana TaxID=48701 RepID=A0A3B3WTY5_9TELE|nr:PREDICTED: fibroblast growth factor-binding protein 1-like [Poecilia mexicana]